MRAVVHLGRICVRLLLCLSMAFTGSAMLAGGAFSDTPDLPSATPTGPADLPEVGFALIDALECWLDAYQDLPRRPAAPRVEPLAPAVAADILGLPPRGHGPARAFYDPACETIYVVTPWSSENPQDVAVLLHELVHHRQVGHCFSCPGARELPAYRAQAAWLHERGLELDANWLAIVLAAGCTPHDIHPD